MPLLLEARGIGKRYPGVQALDNVTIAFNSAEVHCLVGENGAGKSTLMGILSGAFAPDQGHLFIDGTPVSFESPGDSQELGIGIIHQELKLVPSLTVAENVLLGNEPCKGKSPFIDREQLYARASEIIRLLGEEIEPRRTVQHLSSAGRQIVEIAKALSRKVRLLILDEPTAALTDLETQNLFTVIRKLKRDGVGVIYISHRLDEIFEIGDQVTVLRDGKVVQTSRINEVDRRTLIRQMVGREIEQEYPKIPLQKGTELLRLEQISAGMLSSIDLTVYRSEILGIAGLVGAGRSELARVLFGADPIDGGRMTLNGEEYHPGSPREAINAGIGLLPEDRNRLGLVLEMDLQKNVSLSNLSAVKRGPFIDPVREREIATRYISQLDINPPVPSIGVRAFSGGNRQKIVLARWLFTQSRLLIFDEPTAGIDIGAKYDIYQLMNSLAAEGVAIVMISSDLPELLGMCDRIAVMCEGRISGILERSEFTQEKILALATPASGRTHHAA